jgi:glucose-1-phosphate thymidylyltransferase
MREEEKPGAAAALGQLSPMIKDDCLIIAGDNLFTSSLLPLANFFYEKQESVIGVYDVKNRVLAQQYSNVILDDKSRIVQFLEKPSNPKSTLIGTCIYFLPMRILPRLLEFNSQKGNHDSPGRFIEWLYQVEPVYGKEIGGVWWDIGTLEQYGKVNQSMRASSGRAKLTEPERLQVMLERSEF